MTHRTSLLFSFFIFHFAFTSLLQADTPPTPNLLPAPAFDAPPDPATQLPRHWHPHTFPVPATISIDTTTPRSAPQAIKLEANETTRSYIRSALIPIAPGEQLRASAWIKVNNFHRAGDGSGGGTVIVIAQFTQPDGTQIEVAKVGTADVKKTDWQHVEGTVTAPPLARAMRLQVGFSYSSGSILVDDAAVHAVKPLVARIDLPGSRLTPAAGLPVTILNRTAQKGDVTLTATLAPSNLSATRKISLTGEAAQSLDLPLPLTKRGPATLTLSLTRPGTTDPLFTEKRPITIPPPVTLSPPIPTHWCPEDGPPTVTVDADLALTAEQSKGAKLSVKLLDPNDDIKATATAAKLADGWNHLTLNPTENLPEQTYRILAEVTLPDGTKLTSHQPFTVHPRRLAKVTLSPDGYPVYDGKKILPLGIFNGARFEEQAKAGFTVAHGYNAFNIDKHDADRPNDTAALNFLNSAHANGQKVCLLLPRGLMQINDWTGFRRRVRMFKNHPALLCWDEEEELARGNVPPDAIQTVEQIIREEDPHHPLMVGDARTVITRIAKDRSDLFPVDHMDLGMWWWYPLPAGPKPGSALEGEDASTSYELTPPSFLTKFPGNQPIWTGLQFYKKPATARPDTRFPTEPEYRAQAYIALIHGAKGLMWYGGSVTGGGYLPALKDESNWPYLQKLARELNDLSDILMTPSITPPTFTPANAPLSVMLKRTPNKTLLFAVNRDRTPIDITFSSPVIPTRSLPVLNESRTVEATGTSFKDRFEGYATHIYDLHP